MMPVARAGANRALARLARRSIRKAPLRSLLIVLLIALVVAVGVSAGVVMRSTRGNATDERLSAYGQADTLITFGPLPLESHYSHVPNGGEPPLNHLTATSNEERQEQLAVAKVQANEWLTAFATSKGIDRVGDVVGDDALIHRRFFARGSGALGPFGSSSGLTTLLLDVDMSHPLSLGLLELVEGRYPATDDEVTITPSRSRWSSVKIGDTVSVVGREMNVVGIAVEPTTQSDFVVVTPGLMDQIEIQSFDAFDIDYRVRASIDRADLNTVLVAIEKVVGHEFSTRVVDGAVTRFSSTSWSHRTLPEQQLFRGSEGQAVRIVPTLVSVLLGTQITLVAAVAFAVGVRRRTREFGQLSATGADNSQIVRIVLFEGAWLALAGIGIGVVAGLFAARWSIEAGWFHSFGGRYPVSARWRLVDVVGPAFVGLGAALIAAWWPARVLRSTATTTALAGHLPARKLNVRTSHRGLLLICLGIIAIYWLTGIQPYDDGSIGQAALALLWVSAILVCFVGVVMRIGSLLSAAGRRADRFPLLARLVARNADRQRTRSWVVVGAFIATLAIPTLVGASIEGYPRSYGGASQAQLADRVITANASAPLWQQTPRAEAIERIGIVIPAIRDGIEEQFGADAEAQLLTFPARLTVLDRDGSGHGYGGSGLHIATPELVAALGLPADLVTALDRRAVLNVGVAIPLNGRDAVVELGSEPQLRHSVDLRNGPHVTGRTMLLVAPDFAETIGLEPQIVGALFVTSKPVSVASSLALLETADAAWRAEFGPYEQQRGTSLLDSAEVELAIHRVGNSGPSGTRVRWIALGASAALASLIALVTAALSAVELDGELRSMIATGAAPSIRRQLLGAQTLYFLVVAAVLGIPLCLLLWNLVARMDDNGPAGIVIPWTVVAMVLIVIPTLVAGLIALLFRNGSPAVSRRET